MKKSILTYVASALIVSAPAWAGPGHDTKTAKHEEHEHGKEEAGHEEEKEHAHEEEEADSSSVGPDKGVLEASENLGIKLAPEALKNFEIKSQKLSGNGPWTLPITALFQWGDETNLFRLRNGFFKRVDFVKLKRDPSQIVVSSSDLKSGDEIVISGIGYLRIAEVTAFGGAAEGHSH